MAGFASEPLHPLSVDDYHRMIESGILGEDDRAELLAGVLVEVSPEGPAHAAVISRLARHFILALAERMDLVVRIASPLTILPRSEPEPDLAVVAVDDATFTAPRAPRGWSSRSPRALAESIAAASSPSTRAPASPSTGSST